MRLLPPLAVALALALTACGGEKPVAPSTPGESKVAAKAVADVDAAMAEAREPVAVPPQAPAN